MDPILLVSLAVIAVGSILLTPRVKHVDGFFKGQSDEGFAPGLWTLTLSQVTTWIFARSLLTAAILGYYYGLAGGLAYAAYYLSFFTGGAIVNAVRFKHGYDSIQTFLSDRFGLLGTSCYNFVIGVRLLSEVFANLLVIGVIFGESGSDNYTFSIIAMSIFILGYSMLGGLRASLRTDFFQASLVIALIAYLFAAMMGSDVFSFGAVLASSPDASGPGWVLLVVAIMQVWSYPLHDPVMMDRGFIADEETTKKSFTYAGLISVPLILVFSLLGVFAGLNAAEGEALQPALTRLLGETTMIFFQVVLIVSCVSTLDSTFSSAAKLTVVDMGMGEKSIRNGRIAMAAFMVGGLIFLFFGSKDLFTAVAVSGTASMYLAPVIFFSIWGGKRIAQWSYAVAFAAAMAGAALYYVEAGGVVSYIEPLTGLAHKYSKLLVICLGVLVIGNGAFWLGLKREVEAPAAAA